jgi:hypothetical protein
MSIQKDLTERLTKGSPKREPKVNHILRKNKELDYD